MKWSNSIFTRTYFVCLSMQLKCIKHIHMKCAGINYCICIFSIWPSHSIKLFAALPPHLCRLVTSNAFIQLNQKQTKRDKIKLCEPWLDAVTHWISSGYTRFATIKKRSVLSPVLSIPLLYCVQISEHMLWQICLIFFGDCFVISLYIYVYIFSLRKSRNAKQFGSGPDPTFGPVWSGYKLFAKYTSRQFHQFQVWSIHNCIVLYCIALYS